VCHALAHGAQGQDPEAVTLVVRKALSGVARVHDRFGLGMVLKLVRGDAEPRLERAGLTTVPTFGNLREHSEAWLLRVLRRCVAAGWVSFSGGDRPVVHLTTEGRAVMKGTRPARIVLPPVSDGLTTPPGRKPRSPARPLEGEDVLDATGAVLFEALRRHRLELAREAGVPPYVIASDRTLREIARVRPRTPDELSLVYGVGRRKVEQYGAGLLRVVAGARDNG
jgi:ATP-dependent DNA helicase RecQ